MTGPLRYLDKQGVGQCEGMLPFVEVCMCAGGIILFGWICLKKFWKDIQEINDSGFLLDKEDTEVRR